MSLFDKACDEIVSLHGFFVEWFNAATADRIDFSRFELSMGKDMRMITPSGAMLSRAAVIAYVRNCRGSMNGDFSIKIEDVDLVAEIGNFIAVTYIERQERAGVKTARRATALLTESSSTPSGVEWRHLHETWMQAAED